ncbi:MAG: hypothetical protein AAF908_12525 [Pseudomonadota bacterium]
MSEPVVDPLSEIQDAIIAQLEGAFRVGRRSLLSRISGLEVPLSEETSKNVELVGPGAYVLPLVIADTNRPGHYLVRWAVYCLGQRASYPARTGGDLREIGSYGIAMRVLAALDGWNPAQSCASSLAARGCENVTGVAMIARGLNAWAASFDHQVSLSFANDDPRLAEFRTFHADIDLAPFAPEPEDLPAPRDSALNVELHQ